MALMHMSTGAMRAAAAAPSTLSTRQAHRLGCAHTSRGITSTATRCASRSSKGLSAGHEATAGQEQLKGQGKDAYARQLSSIAKPLPRSDAGPQQRLREFELDGRVFIVTGGARGLGLTLAEALVEAGGHVYCLDRLPKPAQEFYETADRVGQFGGSIQYRQVDVSDSHALDNTVAAIAAEHQRIDGLVAAAGVQYISDALDYPPEKITEMMNINYGGVYLSTVSVARQMIKYNCPGSMVLVGSMSGLIANKGLRSSVYNSSKAAVVQLGRSLAMEWGKVVNGRAIRVNVLCPGNILTPMVAKNFEDEPHLKALWESENMMGRISLPEEYRGAALFMLSDASSFMTGSHLVIDGGYTAW